MGRGGGAGLGVGGRGVEAFGGGLVGNEAIGEGAVAGAHSPEGVVQGGLKRWVSGWRGRRGRVSNGRRGRWVEESGLRSRVPGVR